MKNEKIIKNVGSQFEKTKGQYSKRKQGGKSKKVEWRKVETERFINPYNFVSLGEKKDSVRAAIEKGEEAEKFTGILQCRMITKTPIFIPNSSCDHAFLTTKENKLHKNYDFFSYCSLKEGEAKNHYQVPVIPGSEIRGVLRSAYETLSNSCLSSIEDKKLSGRITMPKKPAIVEYQDGKLTLYNAKKVRLQTYENKKGEERYLFGRRKGTVVGDDGKEYETNQLVKFYYDVNEGRIGSKVKELGSGPQKGVLCIGEKMERKIHDSIFIKTGKVSDDYGRVRDAMEQMRYLLEVYQDEASNLKLKDGEHFGYSFIQIPEIPEKPTKEINFRFAVWYEEEGKKDRFYFAPACISRTAYYNTLRNFYKGYEPCEKTDNLCKACELFGMVQKNASHSSKIRVSDAKLLGLPNDGELEAYLKKSVYYDSDKEYITLKTLASPKPSAKEFYLKRPNGCCTWNYDFKTIKYEKQEAEKLRLKQGEMRIRGRKFYWHNPYMKFSKEEQTELNVSVRPLKEGKEFSFQVYFDRVSEEQLNELIWTITLGDNQVDGTHCHKIGMGKPLGMGSVKLIVDRIDFRSLQMQNGTITYNIVSSDSNDYEGTIYPDLKNPFKENEEKTYFKELMIIMDFHALDSYFETNEAILSYPLGYNCTAERDNRDASHQWFNGNRRMKSENEMKENICYTLPEIIQLKSGKDFSLPKFQKD